MIRCFKCCFRTAVYVLCLFGYREERMHMYLFGMFTNSKLLLKHLNLFSPPSESILGPFRRKPHCRGSPSLLSLTTCAMMSSSDSLGTDFRALVASNTFCLPWLIKSLNTERERNVRRKWKILDEKNQT